MIHITRDDNGGHWVGKEPFMPDNVHLYRKTTLTKAVRMHQPFQVQTLEGTMEGKGGDWLMIGAAGEMYPCDAEIFAATYEQVYGLEGCKRGAQ
jgi:hypothetical protein